MGVKPRSAVVAVGGNSLIADSQHESIPDQFVAATTTSEHIADMVEAGWDIVITHGNGPQVGFILRRSELAMHEVPPVPMDYAGADIQGAVGYMFQKSLRNALRARGIERNVVTVVTQTVVDRDDPAFSEPSKPIGSYMSEDLASKRSEEQGWIVREDAGRGFRRVVASPEPREIVELEAIRTLKDSGFIVICCGGGGIPVVADYSGNLHGVEAVIDKDLASSALATALGVDALVISTAVDRVALEFGKPTQRWLERVTLDETRRYFDEGHFLKGSMEPKIRAMIAFLEHDGREGIITNPENLGLAVQDRAGTRFSV